MAMFKVQNPDKDVFNSSDLAWKDDIAYIPTNRLHQFLAGEEMGFGTAPTKFKIMSSRTRKEGSLQVHRIRPECWLKYTRYWCTYGPKDHRRMNGGGEKSSSPLGSDGCRLKRQSNGRGEDFARGCICHFNVKVMYLWPNITQIHYVHKSHTDASGAVCHGTLDPSAIGSKAQFAPRLSMDMRRWVLYLLYRNVPPKQILQEHQLLIEEKRSRNPDYVPMRDDFLNKHDILNISKRLAEETFQMHMSEDESIKIWIQNHQDYVVCYQEEDSITKTSFIVVIQTPWQKHKLATLGNHRVVACNATTGVHNQRFKYRLYTLLVFDMFQNAIPGAWIISSSDEVPDIEMWLQKVATKINEQLLGWRPSCFIVDDAGPEVEAIRNVFEAPVYLCLWHVRRTWLRHLVRRVQSWTVRAAMFRMLGEIMYLSSEQSLSLCNTEMHALKQIDAFLEEYREETSFLCYFREIWLPKMDLWVKAAQNIPHTNLDINSAIEAYHANFKARLAQGKKTVLGSRVDWLLHTLVKDVESHFWFIDFSRRWGYLRNTTQELVIESSMLQAANIPDRHVTLPLVHEGNQATTTIADSKDPTVLYTVYNPDTEWSCCDCRWAENGYMCKHQVKILILKGTIKAGKLGQDAGQRSSKDHNGSTNIRIEECTTIFGSGNENRNGFVDSERDEGEEIEAFEGQEGVQSSSISMHRFEKSLKLFVDAIGEIDNALLANLVATIVAQTARKINRLKEITTPDMTPRGEITFNGRLEFENDRRLDRKQSTKSRVTECRKRKSRASSPCSDADEEDDEHYATLDRCKL